MLRRTGIISALALALAASGAWAAPKLEFISKTTHDFKTVYQGTPVAYGFFFRNAGDQTLVIHDVLKDCGCTTARAVPEKIAPGAKGKISAIFDTSRYSGKQYKTVTVKSNDPDQKEVYLHLSGTVKVAVAIEPTPYLTMGEITTADKKVRTVTVVPVESMKGFKVTKVGSPVPYIRASAPRPSARNKAGFDLTFTIGPGAPVGRVSQDIIVETNHKHQKKVIVRVHANVVAKR
jgi:hypothetical protein